MELLGLRLVGIFGVWVGLIVSALLPYAITCFGQTPPQRKNRRHGSSPRVQLCLSFCNCFASGVFLGACFLGLVPHVRMHVVQITDYFSHAGSNATELLVVQSTSQPFFDWLYFKALHLPYTEILLICGFLMTMFLEQLTHACQPSLKTRKLIIKPIDKSVYKNGSRSAQEAAKPLLTHDSSDDEELHHPHQHHHHMMGPDGSVNFHSLMLMLGLGVHALFEGLALGLQNTVTGFLRLLIGILTHEFLCAFAFGVNLVQHKTRCGVATWTIMLYACCLPLGMAVGLMLGFTKGIEELVVKALFEGLASGTFVYVTCMEMLASEFLFDHSFALKKTFCVCFGFFIFLLVQILT